MELEGWRGSIHMDLAGQRAPEVVADRGRRRWRRPGRSGALGFERERGGHEGLGAVGCVGGSAGCGLGDVGETGGPLDQEHPTVIRHDPREMLLDQSERSIPVLHFLTI